MKDLVWVDSDLRTNRRVGKADSPATWSHPDIHWNQSQKVETMALKWVIKKA